MERRRFFPARHVQHVPGQTVAMDVQLTPKAPAPAGGCQCDVVGAGWLASLTGDGFDVGWEQLPNGLWRVSGQTGSNHWSVSLWQGTPDTFDAYGFPLESPGFRCVDLTLDIYAWVVLPVIVGVLQGRTLCDAAWDVAWAQGAAGSAAQSIHGHRAHAQGNMLYVYPAKLQGDTVTTDTLTARASCGGQTLDTLKLTIVQSP
ncbi:MAG: hypothetical protein Q4F13_06925 [Pseudomonadota bacterium]|nr:hypothetical protein [Pseudomonadota bacterium]